MKHFVIIVLAMLSSVASVAASLSFSGNSLPVWSEKGSATSGLEEIYVVEKTDGVSASITLPSPTSTATVAIWGNQGAAYAVPADDSDISRNGSSLTINRIKGDTGYTITIDDRPVYFWIVDYSAHVYEPHSITPSAEQDCGRAFLDFSGNAAPITYHAINARSLTLSRELELSYTTLQFDENAFAYISAESTATFESIGSTINITAPLCDTYFTLSGDRFLRFWNRETETTSPLFTTTSVDTRAKAVQDGEKPDNQLNVDTDGLGGSAPFDITFSAVVTDAAIFHEWQFANDAEFEDITIRNPELTITRTFQEMGTTYARFVTANSDGTCSAESEVFKVFVGESFLRCPNAFSPGSSEGSNDEWRVSYKSIVSFECYIFNRWGVKVAEFHDPARGWDGRYNGKLAPAGVYYYVIKAVGSDNKKYNLSGDINIVRYTGE